MDRRTPAPFRYWRWLRWASSILIMVLAGEDTTVNTLAWMMHLMAEHPEVQCQMQTEAHQVHL